MTVADIDYIILDEIAREISEDFMALALSFDIPPPEISLVARIALFHNTTPAHLVLEKVRDAGIEALVERLM